jgi:AraC family transcriptional regulator, regulatory protein of adaptative response / methylated-DNA-[protein]-cysteine methyltransferase
MSAVMTIPRQQTRSPETTPFATDSQRWDAVRRRDPAADTHFLYSVATTGVYCRPSCAARPARRENVAFHASAAAAERAGFRPCKRCRPDLPPRRDREAALVAEACRAIEAADELPRLSTLAAQAGLSAHHFHRMFKRIAGVTPKDYAAAHRQRRVQDELRAGTAVTDTIYAAGFNSSGRFYEAAPAMLGMTPSAYRRGGAGEAVWSAVGRCSLGCVLVAATERGICAILLGDEPKSLQRELKERFPQAQFIEPRHEFADWVAQVVRFVDDPGHAGGLKLPLDIRGTAFQRRVWQALQTITAGQTASYSELARKLGQPRAVRAVAGACAANPLAVAIPCHRVVGADGRLTGYRWGLERKRRLLAREQES